MAIVTVDTETCFAERSWTGVEATFSAGFKAEQTSDVKVYAKNPATLVAVLLTAGLHYSVSLGGDGAVTVTPLALPAAPQTIQILRETPAMQGVNFENLGSYAASTHTQLHSRAALRDAEDKFHRNRMLRAPLGDTLAELPAAALRAGKYLAFDGSGNPTISAGTSGVFDSSFYILRGPGSVTAAQLFEIITHQLPSIQLGLAGGGWQIFNNLSADGSFTSKEWIEQQYVTSDTTATTSTTLGPNGGLALRDDSTWNRRNQFGVILSKNQLRNKSQWTPTISGGQVTQITYAGGLARTGYTSGQVVTVVVYAQPGHGTGGSSTVTADGAGTLPSPATLAAATGSGLSSSYPPIIVVEPPAFNAAVTRGVSVDQGPVLALQRQMVDVWPAAGSYLGALHFFGQVGSGTAVPTIDVSYASIGAIVADPNPNAPAGELGFWSIDTNGGNALRWRYGKGIYSEGVTGGDKGAGTINFTKFYRVNREFGPTVDWLDVVRISGQANFPVTGNGLELYHDGSSTGAIRAYNAGTAALQTLLISGSEVQVQGAAGTLIRFGNNAFFANANNTYELGTASLKWKNAFFAIATFDNAGLRLSDTDASHLLTISPGSNLTANRTLTLTTGDASRVVTLESDVTLGLDLTAIEALGSTGLAARTAANTWAQRSVAQSTGITVTNGDGVSGNPTIAVNQATNFAWTGTHTWSNAGIPVSITTSGVNALLLTSTDASSTIGPNIILDRNSASPAPADAIGTVLWQGRNASAGTIQYGKMLCQIVDATAGSEDSFFQISSIIAGAQSDEIYAGGGLQIGAPAGGFQGVGSINLAAGLYRAGTKVVDTRRTGWTAWTGTAARGSQNADAPPTTTQIAQALKALLDDLIAHGLIGA
jgi:hypothetical protein